MNELRKYAYMDDDRFQMGKIKKYIIKNKKESTWKITNIDE